LPPAKIIQHDLFLVLVVFPANVGRKMSLPGWLGKFCILSSIEQPINLSG